MGDNIFIVKLKGNIDNQIIKYLHSLNFNSKVVGSVFIYNAKILAMVSLKKKTNLPIDYRSGG